MSNVVTCSRCGRLYRNLLRGHCADCLEARERDYETVRDHLRENPHARLGSAAEDTGVDSKLIMEFVQEGRLELGSVSDDVRSEQERRQRLAEQLASGARATTSAAAPARGSSPSDSSTIGMATRRVGR